MDNILQKAFDPERFRKEGHQLIDLLADYLAGTSGLSGGPVIPWKWPDEAFSRWENDNRDNKGKPTIGLFRDVLSESIHLHDKKYMGHQISPVAPLAALAGMLGDFLNNGMGIYEMGGPATAIESLVIKKTAAAMGFGKEADGVLTSGGSLANLTALLAARSLKARSNVWKEGNGGQLALMVSEEAHYCIDRAVRIMGWGDEGIIKIPCDGKFRMRCDLLLPNLQKAEKNGKEVIAVIGSACSTSTGSFDDLEAIAAFCMENNLWFHVDGAHGGASVFSQKHRQLVAGIEKADSVIMDFHKMMMTPAIATALIFKNGQNGYHTFSQKAQYLWSRQNKEEWYNLAKRTFECTKAMMGLKVYSLFRAYGSELFEAFVNTTYQLGATLAGLIKERQQLELALEPECNIVCFRFLPGGLDEKELNKLNDRIRDALLRNGEFYIVKTELKGKTWLRTTLVNPFTTGKELTELLDKIEGLGNKIEG